jgi:hypothetical protein
MTIPELNKKLDDLSRDMATQQGTTMVQLGSQALFQIRERVIKTGVNAEGGKYTPYSTKAMLLGCSGFKNKSHCSKVFGKEKNKGLKWVTLDKLNSKGKKIRLAVLEGGYKEFRELNNLQSGFVDFFFNGRMWASIKIKSDNSEHSQGIVRIGATTEVDNKVLEGNTERRGEILMLSTAEIDNLSKTYSADIQQLINKEGL